MQRQRLSRGLAGVAVVALLAAGCGDDDDDAETGTGTEDGAADSDDGSAGADLDAYCDAVVALETAPEPDIDFENATPDEMAAAMREWAGTVMRPLADDVVAAAPDELADDVTVASDAVDEMAETGDFMVWEAPDVVAATDGLHAFDLENCGWAQVPVTTTDYAFEGLPDELPAGVTSFELGNDGAEVHEIVVLRRNDGVTASVEELLELGEEEADEMVTFAGVVGPSDPGAGGYGVVDLAPGDYIALCFIPTGMVTMAEDGPPPEGPPHAIHGMTAEFTVT